MKVGKLPNDVLENIIISKLDKRNSDVLVGPNVGEDCSIIDFGEHVCVLTTDPITAAQNNAGTIGVHICCNDIASAGVKPLGVLVTLLAPPSSTIDEIKNIMKQVEDACGELSIDVLGGHTEITDAVNRIVLSITAIGKGLKNEYVKTGGAYEGDDIIVTGFAGLEGTSIIASDYHNFLKDRVSLDILNRAQQMLKGISVVKAGLISSRFGVTSMHDATEGGILGAIWEVAEASHKGVYIYENKIPVKNETIQICKVLNIDPYRLISSGSMIITCRDGQRLCGILRENGIEASVVGKITNEGRIINRNNIEFEIDAPESDEIYNIRVE